MPAASPAPAGSPTEDLTPREEPAAEPNEVGGKFRRAEADSDDEDDDPEEMLALLQRAEELQRELQSLGSAAQGGAAGTGPAASMMSSLSATRPASGGDELMGLLGSGESASAAMAQALAMQAAPGLLEALEALSSEKSRLEAQLRDEQTTLEKQLQELHAQMAELETLEAQKAAAEGDDDDEESDA